MILNKVMILLNPQAWSYPHRAEFVCQPCDSCCRCLCSVEATASTSSETVAVCMLNNEVRLLPADLGLFGYHGRLRFKKKLTVSQGFSGRGTTPRRDLDPKIKTALSRCSFCVSFRTFVSFFFFNFYLWSVFSLSAHLSPMEPSQWRIWCWNSNLLLSRFVQVWLVTLVFPQLFATHPLCYWSFFKQVSSESIWSTYTGELIACPSLGLVGHLCIPTLLSARVCVCVCSVCLSVCLAVHWFCASENQTGKVMACMVIWQIDGYECVRPCVRVWRRMRILVCRCACLSIFW